MGGKGYFARSNDFYLPSLRLEEEGGGQHPMVESGAVTYNLQRVSVMREQPVGMNKIHLIT